MKKRCSIAEARRHLASIVRAAEKGAVVELTRRGEPVAILLSVEGYATLAGPRADLWDALTGFRESANLRELDVEEVYRDVRDRTPGRAVGL